MKTDNDNQNASIETRGNWEVLSRDVKYENPYGLRVAEDQVIRPDGKRGIYGMINVKRGVYVVPVDEKGYVYLIDSFIYPWNQRALGCITGGIKGRETNRQCAEREMKEETGLVADRMDSILKFQPFDVLYSPQEAFLARGLSQALPKPEGTEEIEVVKMPFESAMGEIDKRIVEACSIAVLYKARDAMMEDKIKCKIKTPKKN